MRSSTDGVAPPLQGVDDLKAPRRPVARLDEGVALEGEGLRKVGRLSLKEPCDGAEAEAEAERFQRQDFVQPGDLAAAVEPPLLGGAAGRNQAVLLVEPERAHRKADAFGAFLGGEQAFIVSATVHRKLLRGD